MGRKPELLSARAKRAGVREVLSTFTIVNDAGNSRT
jgi:hypothetical protein